MKLEAGQVAVVTGGASGFGLALAHEFAKRGLDVVLGDVETDPLGHAVAAVEEHDVRVLGVPTDVTDLGQMEALAQSTLDHFGRVDVICNNAGVASLGPFMWETPSADWRWVLSVNLGGVINGVRAFVPHLVSKNSGYVVNTASMAGITVTSRNTPYTASKFAVAGLSEALRRELDQAAPNVGVTVVFLGTMSTNIFTADRNRPASLPSEPFDFSEEVMDDIRQWAGAISGPEIMATEAAAVVARAIEANRLHVTPNGNVDAVRALFDPLLVDLEQR